MVGASLPLLYANCNEEAKLPPEVAATANPAGAVTVTFPDAGESESPVIEMVLSSVFEV